MVVKTWHIKQILTKPIIGKELTHSPAAVFEDEISTTQPSFDNTAVKAEFSAARAGVQLTQIGHAGGLAWWHLGEAELFAEDRHCGRQASCKANVPRGNLRHCSTQIKATCNPGGA